MPHFFARRYSSIAHSSPLAYYRAKVRAGSIAPSSEQFRLVQRLETLQKQLVDYDPSNDILFKNTTPATQDITPTNTHRSLFSRSILSSLFSRSAPPSTPSNPSTIIPVSKVRDAISVPKGLWIHGGVGTGKTTLLDLFYDTLPVRTKQRTHFHAFMLSVYATMNEFQSHQSKGSFRSEDVMTLVAKRIRSETTVLCFDEFQIVDIATANILRTLFTQLWQFGVVLVATSNRVPDDLYSGGFQRKQMAPFIKLIKDQCEVYSLEAKQDYRVQIHEKEKAHGTFYFRSDDNSSMKKYDLLEASLKRESKVTSVQVFGRDLAFRTTPDGLTAFTTFEELCKQPFAAADYIQFCNKFQTIFLRDIPVLKWKDRDEARRLITFIDAIYETKARLICLAASDPENIFKASIKNPEMIDQMQYEMMDEMYQDAKVVSTQKKDSNDIEKQWQKSSIFTGEEEVFAFRRAVSRLKEIQTAQYQTTHEKRKIHYSEVPLVLTRKSDVSMEAGGNRYGLNAPQFKNHHFWGMAEWGPKAGPWGRSKQ